MDDRERVAKRKTTGPFSPPHPTEVESSGPEPMAVARDKEQTHGESFHPTTAPMDAFDEDVARRYKQVPERPAARAMMPKSDVEKRAAEHPEGYSEPDADGWVEPKDE